MSFHKCDSIFGSHVTTNGVCTLKLDVLFSFLVISVPLEEKKYEEKEDGLPVDIKLPVKHVLSRELQVYSLQSPLFLLPLF